jgi:hypothetical protein
MMSRRWPLIGLLILLLLPAQPGWAATPGANGFPTTGGVAPTVLPIGVGAGWTFFSWGAGEGVLDIQGPFTVTTVGPAALRVTDAFCFGDRFRLLDGSTVIGETSPESAADCANSTSNPDVAFRQPRYSTGCFPLPPGSHAIRAQVLVNPFDGGGAYLRVDAGTCDNAAPRLLAFPSPLTTGEGLTTFASAFVSDFENDPISLQWTIQPGAGVDPGAACTIDFPTSTFTAFRCTDDGAYTLVVSADDGRGGTASVSIDVTVTNQPPVFAGPAPPPGANVPSNAQVFLTANLTDLGANDTSTCRITWGDGTTSIGVVAGDVCSGDHRYPATGRYVARLLATDDDSGHGSTTIPFNIGGSACGAGRVSAAVIGIDPVGGAAAAFAPTDLTRAGTTGLFPNTRSSVPRAGAAATTYVARGETVITGLYVTNVDGAAHPGLALRIRYPQNALGLIPRVVAADGQSAFVDVLGSRPLPRPLPTFFFAAFDRTGDLLIINPPQDGQGNFLPIYVANTVRPSAAGTLTSDISVAGEVVNGQLRGGLANVSGSLCADKAVVAVAPIVGGPVSGAQPIGDLPFYPF